MHPPHGKALEVAEKEIRTLVESQTDSADPDTADAAKDIIRLLDMPRTDIADPTAFLGNWRVRSIQPSSRGVYAYPYFGCKFTKDGDGVIFHKDKGSQRRKGLLIPDNEKRLLLVAGSYYDYESPRTYTGLQELETASAENDRVAYVYQLGKNHLIMLFAESQYGYEVYELKR